MPTIYGDLEIQSGTISTPGLVIPNGASAGYFLTSDSSGNAAWSDPTITTTLSNLLISASNSTLQPGYLYHITDAASSLYGGTEIILRALSNTELDSRGMGKFYNPKYTSATYSGVWNNTNWFTAGSFTGTFSANENITSNSGAVGKLKGLVNSSNFTFFSVTSGTWSGSTSITGNTSGVTCSISSVTLQSYSIGEKVIWGGKVWENLTGNVGSSLSEYALDGTNWSEVSYNTTDYNEAWNEITYDIDNDFITSRRDYAGNYVEQSFQVYDNEFGEYSIRSFQWGNEDKVYANHCIDSWFEIINFKGIRIEGNKIQEVTWFYNNELGKGFVMSYCLLRGYFFFDGNFFFRVSGQTSIYQSSFEDTSYFEDNYFTNSCSITAIKLQNGLIYQFVVNNLNMYDCCLLGGASLFYFNNNSSSIISLLFLHGAAIRFQESVFPYNKINFAGKNIRGITSMATDDANNYFNVTSTTSPIFESGSYDPSKQLIRNEIDEWKVVTLTSGGTFSVVSV